MSHGKQRLKRFFVTGVYTDGDRPAIAEDIVLAVDEKAAERAVEDARGAGYSVCAVARATTTMQSMLRTCAMSPRAVARAWTAMLVGLGKSVGEVARNDKLRLGHDQQASFTIRLKRTVTEAVTVLTQADDRAHAVQQAMLAAQGNVDWRRIVVGPTEVVDLEGDGGAPGENKHGS